MNGMCIKYGHTMGTFLHTKTNSVRTVPRIDFYRGVPLNGRATAMNISSKMDLLHCPNHRPAILRQFRNSMKGKLWKYNDLSVIIMYMLEKIVCLLLIFLFLFCFCVSLGLNCRLACFLLLPLLLLFLICFFFCLYTFTYFYV